MDLYGEGDASGACSCNRLRRGVDGGGSEGTAREAWRAVGGGDERCFRFILGGDGCGCGVVDAFSFGVRNGARDSV